MMSRKVRAAPFVVVTTLVIAAVACGGGAATTAPPTSAPAASAPAADSTVAGLEVVQVTGYVDTYGYYHVVGIIKNQGDSPASEIELTIELKDADGQTLLEDNDAPVDSLTWQPLLYTLAPGAESPFDYYQSTDQGQPESYTVTITGRQTGDASEANVEVQNARLTTDGSSTWYIAGELVNLGDQPAEINGLAGAVLDDSGALAGTDYTLTTARHLAPAGDEGGSDRAPFVVSVDGAEGVEFTDFATYVDAEQAEAPDLQIAIQLANAYFDDSRSFHVVGTVTNNGSEIMNVGLVAGLYDTDGNVLDASTLSVPVYVEPDTTVPFSFNYFSLVNWSSEVADAVDGYTVQLDPYWSYPTSWEVVSLESTNDVGSDDGSGVWTFSGDVENTSDQVLSSETVIVAILNPDDELVAAEYASIYPDGDAINPGDANSFEVTLRLDPSQDTSDYTFQTIVQGYVK